MKEEAFITECPSCQLGRLHTAEDVAGYHPLAGHGYYEGQGWTSEAARLAHEADVAKAAEEAAKAAKAKRR